MTVYVRNKQTGKFYRVLKFDKTEGTITLQGTHHQFDEPYSKERFEKMGYELVKGDVADGKLVVGG